MYHNQYSTLFLLIDAVQESNVEVDPYDRERYRELNAILRMFNDGDVEAPLTSVHIIRSD